MSQHLPTPRGSSSRRGPLRIGDAERDQAVAVLSDHFVAGRLTQEEFEERSGQATRARYDNDLAPLFDDLPEPAATQSGPSRWSPGFRSGPQRMAPPPILWLLPVLMIGLVIATITFAAPWFLWVFFWIALLGGPHHHGRWQPPHRR